MSLNGTRLRILEICRRRPGVFLGPEKDLLLRRRLGRYRNMMETCEREAATQSCRVAGLGGISPTDLVI